MENKSHALAAGTFVLVVLALLTALVVWLTRDKAEQRVFEISSAEGVTGLQPQAGVRYKGVLVGRVTDIGLDKVQKGNVLLRIAVNEQAPITQSTFAVLGFQGVTGLAFVQLDDKGENPAPLEASANGPARIPMRASMVTRFTEQGGNLLTQMEQASTRVNTLLDAQNQKALITAIQQMGQAAANVSLLAQRADQVLGVQGEAALKSMQSTSERLSASAEAVRNSAAEFQRMSRRMNEPGGTLDKIAQGTEALAHTSRQVNGQLLPRLSRATDDTARTLRQVGRAADAVGENPQSLIFGKGQAVPGPGERGFVAPAATAAAP